MFPMISEAFWNEKVTVGPPYYNAWVQPIGLVIFALMGIGTLLGWKKTSPQLLRRAFFWPLAITAATIVLHFAFGAKIGFAPIVWGDPIYAGSLGQGLRAFNAITPMLGIALFAFNITIVVQEFVMLFRARAKSGADKEVPSILWYAGLLPGFAYTMVTLPPPSRRRYGGYIVHLGILLMFLGFTGKSWTVDREASLAPHQTMQADHYQLEYIGSRMEVDLNKRMIFADLKVTDLRTGRSLGTVSPAKFIYKKQPDSATTEVAQLNSFRDDLYVVVGTVNPQTKNASFQVHVNPLVGWNLVRVPDPGPWERALHVAAVRARGVAQLGLRAIGRGGRGERDHRDRPRDDAGARLRAVADGDRNGAHPERQGARHLQVAALHVRRVRAAPAHRLRMWRSNRSARRSAARSTRA